jgi:hypothetical protein
MCLQGSSINDTGENFATWTADVVNDTDGKFATGVAKNGTISDCLHSELELEVKNYLYVNSTTQRCPNKIIKTFHIGDFCICQRCK